MRRRVHRLPPPVRAGSGCRAAPAERPVPAAQKQEIVERRAALPDQRGSPGLRGTLVRLPNRRGQRLRAVRRRRKGIAHRRQRLGASIAQPSPAAHASFLLPADRSLAQGPRRPRACQRGHRRRACPRSAGQAALQILNAASAGIPRDFRCPPTRRSAAGAVAASACRTSCRMSAVTRQPGHGAKGRGRSLDQRSGGDVAEIVGRQVREQRRGRCSSARCGARSTGSGLLLEVVGRQPVVLFPDERVEERPGLARDPAQEE